MPDNLRWPQRSIIGNIGPVRCAAARIRASGIGVWHKRDLQPVARTSDAQGVTTEIAGFRIAMIQEVVDRKVDGCRFATSERDIDRLCERCHDETSEKCGEGEFHDLTRIR